MIQDEARQFGENIKKLRKSKGLSQKEMAQTLNIGVKSLSALEKGTTPPRLNTSIIIKMYRIFGIKPSQMFSQNLFN